MPIKDAYQYRKEGVVYYACHLCITRGLMPLKLHYLQHLHIDQSCPENALVYKLERKFSTAFLLILE